MKTCPFHFSPNLTGVNYRLSGGWKQRSKLEIPTGRRSDRDKYLDPAVRHSRPWHNAAYHHILPVGRSFSDPVNFAAFPRLSWRAAFHVLDGVFASSRPGAGTDPV